ncbi:MAG: hypothetical protein JRI41_06780 [Deltaproteobacteria bacterium]|nr:hypothetical protein [Deltaproteobacteria bacterium]
MSVYYYAQDPVRYQMEQQSRRDQQMRTLLNMLLAAQQMKQQQSQWAAEQERLKKSQALEEMRARAYAQSVEQAAKPKPATPPDWLVQAQLISQQTGEPLGAVIRRIKLGLTPEEEAQRKAKIEEATQKVRAKYEAPTLQKKKIDTTVKRQSSLINTALSRYSRERERLISARSKTEDAVEAAEIERRLNNINLAISQLDSMQSTLAQGVPLSDIKWNLARNLNSYKSKVANGSFWGISGHAILESNIPPGTQRAVNQETGEEIAYINGKWIPIIK